MYLSCLVGVEGWHGLEKITTPIFLSPVVRWQRGRRDGQDGRCGILEFQDAGGCQRMGKMERPR